MSIHEDTATLEPDSDIHALRVERVVAVTPLSLDATSRADFTIIRKALAPTS